MSINPKSWAEAFTAELTIAGEHVPLDRVVARHSDAFTELRQLGMTWRGISTLLVRAGARRADGGLISSDQLRVSYARFDHKRASPNPRPKRQRAAPPPPNMRDAPPLASEIHRAPAVTDEGPPASEKDVSGSEIEAALLRLTKLEGLKK